MPNEPFTDPLAAALRVKELEKAGLHGCGNDAAPGRRAEIVRLAPILADAVLAKDAENERLNDQLDADINVGVRQCELLREARAEIGRMKDERDKLQAFKTWVHGFLDGKGVPHHPPGTHGAAGCRIGDRMDYVFAEMERLKKRDAELEDQLVRIAAYIGKDARHAPETDSTVAGAVIAEMERLKGVMRECESNCGCCDDNEPCANCFRIMDALAAAPPPEGER